MLSCVEFTRPQRAATRTQFIQQTPDGLVVATAGEPVLSPPGSPRDLATWRASWSGPVTGMLPFDGDRIALAPAGDLAYLPGAVLPPARPHRWPRLAGPPWTSPDPAGYRAAVTAALAELGRPGLDKVVLGRFAAREFDAPLPAGALLARLAAAHPGARIYQGTLPGGDVLLGASPELLLARHGQVVRSHPLAGSAPRSAEPARDHDSARSLLRSAKDQREHALVAEMVADTLAPYCRALHVPSEPVLVATRTLWHLGTLIEGQLRAQTPSVELAAALQPTPALCGSPREAARALIGRLEPAPREWFGGAIGWEDERGDGEWTVAIRGARVCGRHLVTFAGAGIVTGSDPEAELLETDAKLAALSDVLLGTGEDTGAMSA